MMSIYTGVPLRYTPAYALVAPSGAQLTPVLESRQGWSVLFRPDGAQLAPVLEAR